MHITKTVVIEVKGRPSPWANQPHEGIWRKLIAEKARELVPSQWPPETIPSRVEVDFRMTKHRRGDLDNLAKPVLDTLFRQSRASKHPVACFFQCDDFHLSELVLRRKLVESEEEEGARISIEFADSCPGNRHEGSEPLLGVGE
ncbi:MAG: hypothetical protein JST40_11685 [Armatimonadetes bacterium]|nr:hypothetical protein [Armatimonadota bacterium]